MPGIDKKYPFVSIKKLVVFKIGGDVGIGPAVYGIFKQKTPASTTNGYFFNGFFRSGRYVSQKERGIQF